MDDTVERLLSVINACAGLSPDDTLFTLELAWLSTASNMRNQQLAVPGGFPAERDRQAERLEKMAAIVRSDAPDLEMERLFAEGDLEGLRDHVRRLIEE